MREPTPKTIRIYFAKMGKKGGKATGPTKLRGGKDYYARIRKICLEKKAGQDLTPPPIH